MLRVAGGASSVLVGVYIAGLANRGLDIGAGLVGTLAAISFGAELLGAVPLGMLSDRVPARAVMTSGALLAALATWPFGVTQEASVFVVSRALEGLAAAAGVPALLAYLTDATADDHRLRARAMSYFELSLLAGLALGGIVGGRLWVWLHTGAFTALALLYGVAALLLFVGSVGTVAHRGADVWQGLKRALATPQLRRLAPVWIRTNAILGLWLEALGREGIDVALGPAAFENARTLRVGERSVVGRPFLVCTGATPVMPAIAAAPLRRSVSRTSARPAGGPPTRPSSSSDLAGIELWLVRDSSAMVAPIGCDGGAR